MSEHGLNVQNIPRPQRPPRRRYVSLSKGRTPLGLPDDLPVGAHPFDAFLILLGECLGYEKGSLFLGLDPATGEPLETP